MLAPMNPMTERIRINNERRLNEAQMAADLQPKHNRLAVLVQRLTIRRRAA